MAIDLKTKASYKRRWHDVL